MNLLGINVIPSALLPSRSIVHTGHWLDGYRPSKNRSKRLIKKLTQGTKKNPFRRIVREMQEERVTHAFMMNGTLFASSDYVALIAKVLSGLAPNLFAATICCGNIDILNTTPGGTREFWRES